MKKDKNKKPVNKWKLTAIISFVINGLVALLLAVGLGLQSPTTKVSAVNESNSYLYDAYSINTQSRSQDIQSQSFLSRLSDIHSYTDYLRYSRNTSNHTFQYYFYNIDFPFTIESLNYDYSVAYNTYTQVGFVYDESNALNPILLEVYIYPQASNSIIYIWQLSNTSNYGYYEYYSRYRISSDNSYFLSVMDRLLYKLGTEEVLTNYTADSNFNPNKYISVSSDSLGFLYNSPNDYYNPNYFSPYRAKWYAPRYYESVNGMSEVSTLGWFEIPILFSSNGEVFNGIRIYYDVVQYYKDSNNELQVIDYSSNQDHAYHYTFAYMSYVYDLSTALGSPLSTWREKIVCATPIYNVARSFYVNSTEYRAYCYYLNQPLKWLGEEYKTISIHDYSKSWIDVVAYQENISVSRLAINNLTIGEILSYDMSQTSPNIQDGSNYGIGNVLILIRSGFESIIPLLSIAILPGISIGMLMFLPLVLTIIIVVIKLVKK